MKLRKLLSLSIAAILLCFTGCVNKNTLSKHEPITILAPYLECDRLVDLVHKKYPEINLKVLSYSGANTTTYLQNMLAADDLPDICTQTIYDPNIDDVSDKMIDLAGYDFTDNYVESRLQDISDDGAIYMLPSAYSCIGITYNKTLLEKHGWKLPKSFHDLEKLAKKAKKAGVQLCLTQIEYPGYGFQYMCNIADTAFLGTFQGKQWQKDYLTGKANVSDTKKMMDCMDYIQKWKDLGMFTANKKNPQSDDETIKEFMKVISSVEGTSALYEEATLKANLLPFKDWNADNTYYGDIADEINAGNTAPLIYVGWENTLVNTGYRMLEYIQDKATIKDVVDQLDKDQDRVVNNKPEVITTTTEVISQKSCAKLIGRCFMEATKSDAALISLGKWIKGNGKEQNMAGVNGKLYAQDITESDICSILPTGWYDTIQTVQLSGREIKQLCKDGYDAAGTGNTYPYVLVKDKKLEADQTYKVVICGAGKELTLNDSGIVGMNAAKDFFSKFKTLSEADVK